MHFTKNPIYYQLVPARNAYIDESSRHETEPMKHPRIVSPLQQVFGSRNQAMMSENQRWSFQSDPICTFTKDPLTIENVLLHVKGQMLRLIG